MWNVTTKVIPVTIGATETTRSHLEHAWATNQKARY